ncbi:NAD(P)-binding protein [Pluteus cervinus]|uniref:NAD(P)-binding protein n=1 Tax=Pluteus cervinus TaxID=181527 RepID=A0ACD3B9K1_9AGAR|nr:NAD(P)-binding protein [Pluteus cervinus]
MALTILFVAWGGGLLLTLGYLRRLSRRLQTPHPLAKPQPKLTPYELEESSNYAHIDMLHSIPRTPTHTSYAVIGGSGFLGSYIVRLLLLRGETNIRIIDLHPPAAHLKFDPERVSFVKADITSFESIRAALLEPLPSTGQPPSVIYHTAAIIRFWERFSYCWNASYRVNVLGTQNILAVARELPSAIVIYTSTGDAAIHRPRFLRLETDPERNVKKLAISDYDPPVPRDDLSEGCYTQSKLQAEDLIIAANNPSGSLKTGIIRPALNTTQRFANLSTILGPNDRMITSTLALPKVPVWDKVWSSTSICVWDAAASHLHLEDAMRNKPNEASGQAFLVTGKGPAWTINDVRLAVKQFAQRKITLTEVPPLLIFTVAHLVELFCLIRYYVLLPSYITTDISKLSLAPKWMGQLSMVQPTMFDYMVDVVIDDSRARKVLGYQPQWETTQTIRWAVEEVESGSSGDRHGLELK